MSIIARLIVVFFMIVFCGWLSASCETLESMLDRQRCVQAGGGPKECA